MSGDAVHVLAVFGRGLPGFVHVPLPGDSCCEELNAALSVIRGYGVPL